VKRFRSTAGATTWMSRGDTPCFKTNVSVYRLLATIPALRSRINFFNGCRQDFTTRRGVRQSSTISEPWAQTR